MPVIMLSASHAGLGLDDHLLCPHLPHLRATVGTERLTGPVLHGQVVFDGRAGMGKGNQVLGLTTLVWRLCWGSR